MKAQPIRAATHALATLVLPLLALALPAPAPAQEAGSGEAGGEGLSVTRSAIAREIEDREPVEEGTSFPADVGHLVCFTLVEGAEGEAVVHHVWSHGGTERARVELPVRSASWRTWSRKTIPAEWPGEWTVTVEDDAGHVLTRLMFTVGAEGGAAEGNAGESPGA
jgi:hypothetical protein